MQTVSSIVLSINGNDAKMNLPAGHVVVNKTDLAALLKQNAAQARLLAQAAKQLTAAKFNPDNAAKLAGNIQEMLG